MYLLRMNTCDVLLTARVEERIGNHAHQVLDEVKQSSRRTRPRGDHDLGSLRRKQQTREGKRTKNSERERPKEIARKGICSIIIIIIMIIVVVITVTTLSF